MTVWSHNPAPLLEDVFSDIAATRMAGLPILNPALQVEAVGFARGGDGHWTGALVTPWSLNLLRLPGAEGWPATPAGGNHDWRFASGDYAFIVADEARLGIYHLCSLFSPVPEFADHEAARLTALAALAALDRPPLPAMAGGRPDDPAHGPAAAAPLAVATATATAHTPRSRRAFLGLGR